MKAWDYYKKLLSMPVSSLNNELIKKSPHFWEEKGEQKALEVFHEAAKRVPAYKDFLKKNNIDYREIKNMDDFRRIPEMDKKNYLKLYSLKDLCWDGDITKLNVISVSSGSTGNPFFWPRDIWQEKEVDLVYNLVFKYLFQADKKTTLQVIALAMGMYVAGPFTFASSLRFAQQGNPLAITTPGTDIDATLSVIKNLAPNFEQLIISGYPPLVKEIIDTGEYQGINWKDMNVRLTFGGEGFSEKWRDYMHDKISAISETKTTINMYGTADASLLGFETPLSISFRRLLGNNIDTRVAQFGDERLPSIVSYNPLIKYFEQTIDGELLFTSSSGIPVVRYNIGDSGGIIPYGKVKNTVPEKILPDWKLPIVYLFGRSDNTVHIYGANVYPENVKEALLNKSICNKVTGRFLLSTKHRENMDPYLDIEIELTPGTEKSADLKEETIKIITNYLRHNNSEYENTFKTIGLKAVPHITLIKDGDERFKYAIKPRWITKINDQNTT